MSTLPPLLLVAASLAAAPQTADPPAADPPAAGPVVERGAVFEVAQSVSPAPADPLRGVSAKVVFTGPGGRTAGVDLFWDGGGDQLSIFAGSLDAPSGLVLDRHIHCEDKGDYYDIADKLPQFSSSDR